MMDFHNKTVLHMIQRGAVQSTGGKRKQQKTGGWGKVAHLFLAAQ